MTFFTTIGIITSIIFVAILIMYVCACLFLCIQDVKRKYQYKHRFNKPPKAKCYCIDCKNHNAFSRKCSNFEIKTADDWFCCNADPKTIKLN